LGRWALNERLIDHSIQAALIFASVFLAFWLNDYRHQVVERQNTEAAREAVINEVRTNRDILERWVPYHREVSHRVEARLQDGAGDGTGSFNPYEFMDERGVFREILTYDSWEYLRQSGVRLDLDTRLAVNRVFQQQQYVDRAVRAVVDFLNDRELFDPDRAEENRVIFFRLITDLYHQEVAMLETYERFLETVQDEGRMGRRHDDGGSRRSRIGEGTP
jgi:hypothetical protein